MKKGIDVSSYQGDINWEEAKKYIDFTIIRCGWGNNLVSQDDPKFKRNATYCENLEIPFGVYLFSYATTLADARSEAEHTLRLIKDYQLEYPIFLDVEAKEQLRLPKETLVAIINEYCKIIESAGYYVGIYASLYTLERIIDAAELDKYDKWVADWAKDLHYKGKHGLWQNTDHEMIRGVPTKVDGDIAFYDYPKIIREAGLNHLKTKFKYKKGDTVYLNGPMYKDKDGKEIKKVYHNKKVAIKEVNEEPGTVAPYKVSKKGYAKETHLSKEKMPSSCFLLRIIRQIINWFS